MIPHDWKSLLKAVLELGASMQFKTWWEDEAKQQAKKNQETTLQLPWSSYWAQLMYDDQAINQV